MQFLLTEVWSVMKYIMNPVAGQEMIIMHSSAGTRRVKHCAQSGQKSNLAFGICAENESWIHLSEASISAEVVLAALFFFNTPALALESF